MSNAIGSITTFSTIIGGIQSVTGTFPSGSAPVGVSATPSSGIVYATSTSASSVPSFSGSDDSSALSVLAATYLGLLADLKIALGAMQIGIVFACM